MTPQEAKVELERSRKGRPMKEWYRDFYVHSAHWHALRDAKLKDSPRCKLCGNSWNLQVHHLNYRNIYDVTKDDLETRCKRCHTTQHGHKYWKEPVDSFLISRYKVFRANPR